MHVSTRVPKELGGTLACPMAIMIVYKGQPYILRAIAI